MLHWAVGLEIDPSQGHHAPAHDEGYIIVIRHESIKQHVPEVRVFALDRPDIGFLGKPPVADDDNRLEQLAALAQQRAPAPDDEAKALEAQIDALVYALYHIEELA